MDAEVAEGEPGESGEGERPDAEDSGEVAADETGGGWGSGLWLHASPTVVQVHRFPRGSRSFGRVESAPSRPMPAANTLADVGALDRWDDWEDEVDDWFAAADRPLEELYDDGTVEAIEAGGGEPARRRPRLRSAVIAAAAGAAAGGLARGVHDALADDDAEPEEAGEIEIAPAERRLEPVTVVLVPGDPAASVAIVRRWLL